MAKKRVGELPSGNVRKKVYIGMGPAFDKKGNPIIDPTTGKQKIVKKYESITCNSSSEVNQEKSKLKSDKKKKKYPPHNLTLYDAIDRYIESKDALLSPSTIGGYRDIQKNAFRSIIFMKLSDITHDILVDAINSECKRKKKNRFGQEGDETISPKTVHNEYGLIKTILALHTSLNLDVPLPQLEINQHELSTPDVIYNMVKGTDIELAVLLAMWLSFSESEILGLTKSKSISSDGKYITINEVIVKDEHNKEVVKRKGKETTRNRTLRIPSYIKNLIDKVETDRLVPFTSAGLYSRWLRLVRKSGIPHMTFHDLRHVNASVMTLLNIPDKYAQERGGWKTDHIMKSTYMQTFSSERIDVDDKIDNYMCDVMFHNSSEHNFSKKYQCWLTLFDKKDTAANQKKFKTFCTEHKINL